MFETHVFGPLRLTRAILPSMRSAHRGTIAHVVGIGSLRGLAEGGCSPRDLCLPGAAGSLSHPVSLGRAPHQSRRPHLRLRTSYYGSYEIGITRHGKRATS
jgi:NAD(P)-dependent dehydrogenase (short-subunit alcohol dehydrogenase family)